MMTVGERLWRSFELVLKMLRARGKTLPPQVATLSEEHFLTAHLHEYQSQHKTEVDVGDQMLLVFLHLGGSPLRGAEWKAIAGDIDRRCEDGSLAAKHAIVVVEGEVSLAQRPVETKHLTSVEVFEQQHVLLDVVNHRLQPKFQLLTPAEAAEVLAHYEATITQLPVMKMDDPIARYFALKRGDVLMCLRKSESAGQAVSYRAVF